MIFVICEFRQEKGCAMVRGGSTWLTGYALAYPVNYWLSVKKTNFVLLVGYFT